MFTYNLDDVLKKKVNKLAKRDKILAQNFKRKIKEVIVHDRHTISNYKNLKSPLHDYKRIHLTGSHVLLFKVDLNTNHIVFMDIIHRDYAY